MRFRQHPADLDLGVGAGADAPEYLDDKVFVDDDAGVRLLAFNHARALRRRRRHLGETASGAEFNTLLRVRDRRLGVQFQEKTRDEIGLARDIEQRTFARTVPHSGEHIRQLRPQPVEAGPLQAERQKIAAGILLCIGVHQSEEEFPAPVRQRHDGPQRGCDLRLLLFGKPAPPREERRQHVLFEQHPRAACAERLPAVVHNESDEFRHPRFGLRLRGLDQLEPEEPVGSKGKHVRHAADARETRPPQQLLRLTSLPGREVELGSLRGTRQIGDAENGLAFILTKIGKHRAICRAHETESAAPEHAR